MMMKSYDNYHHHHQNNCKSNKCSVMIYQQSIGSRNYEFQIALSSICGTGRSSEALRCQIGSPDRKARLSPGRAEEACPFKPQALACNDIQFNCLPRHPGQVGKFVVMPCWMMDINEMSACITYQW